MSTSPPSTSPARALFSVRVPATSANLGPGFDAIGMALDLANVVHVAPAEALAVRIEGEGAGVLAEGPDNLVYQAMTCLAERLGEPPPPVRLHCVNAIPLARGLGSSSAAIVAGLVAANHLYGDRLSPDALLELAVALEGHPDNVAPALLGGVRVCVQTDAGVCQAPVPLRRPLRAVLFVPDFPMPTEAARRALPATVPLPDAVFNLGRAALLVAALATGAYDLLREATRDRLHQPARTALFPAMPAFFAAALEAGALGACLSGAGSTVLALVETQTAAVAAALETVAAREGIGGRIITTAVGAEGARVLP